MDRTSVGRKRVVLVDSNPLQWRWLQGTDPDLDAAVYDDFVPAREALLNDPPDFLITNLRLGAYNGLHLVYLALASNPQTRAITYGSMADLSLIREAQEIGAFFESPERVTHALLSYLHAPLPMRDRRAPKDIDRRSEYRGGRRLADLALHAS